MTITCLKCAHESESAEPLEHGIFVCSECNARMSFGVLMPRIVVNVESPNFVTISFDGEPPKKLDAQYAAMLAKNLLSVALP